MQNKQKTSVCLLKMSIWNSYNQKSKHQINQPYRSHLDSVSAYKTKAYKTKTDIPVNQPTMEI